jgi:hypothetical protein
MELYLEQNENAGRFFMKKQLSLISIKLLLFGVFMTSVAIKGPCHCLLVSPSPHLSSSSWSASTFAALDRAKVSNNLKAKRNRLKFQEIDSQSIGTAGGRKMSRKKRYQRVKALWDERVAQSTNTLSGTATGHTSSLS